MSSASKTNSGTKDYLKKNFALPKFLKKTGKARKIASSPLFSRNDGFDLNKKSLDKSRLLNIVKGLIKNLIVLF